MSLEEAVCKVVGHSTSISNYYRCTRCGVVEIVLKVDNKEAPISVVGYITKDNFPFQYYSNKGCVVIKDFIYLRSISVFNPFSYSAGAHLFITGRIFYGLSMSPGDSSVVSLEFKI